LRNSIKNHIKAFRVIKDKKPVIIGNGENDMPMNAIDESIGISSDPILSVRGSTRRTKVRFTSVRYNMNILAVSTNIGCISYTKVFAS